MADEAEKKKIAELEFGIGDAIKNLDTVDAKLKSIADSSNLYSKKIGQNIGSSLDFSKIVNVDSFSKQLSQVAQISDSQAKKLVANIMKNEQDITAKTRIEQEKRNTIDSKLNATLLTSEAKKADKIAVINEEKNAKIELANIKHQNKLEEMNSREVKSTQTMYDKIMSMGETYVMYQGFNALKQGIRETIDEMVDLESQMVAIDRVLNDSELNIVSYRDKLLGIASDYGNEMSNVADVALRLAQAGYDQNEVLELTKKTMLALNTADLNATQATDDMVAIMAQWGLMTGTAAEQANNYGLIIDKVNKVADNFPTTSADVMDALKKVSSAFNLAGASIDETIATIVAAEKASQRGGKAIGTALSNITQQLKDDKRLDIAESLGLNFFKDAKKTEFKDIMDIFQEMADKMQALKDAGKENSVEMQNLLSIFTVFRRNIGASLLGEMSDSVDGLSTYQEVLDNLATSAGYSLSENEKYLKTAKAAQAQFNNELLRLKTEVWDNGVEKVYRDMLSGGIDLIKSIEGVINKFGVLPTTIGVAIAAFTLLNKNTKLFSYNAEENKIKLSGFLKAIADGTKELRENNAAIAAGAPGIKYQAKAFGDSALEIGKYTTKMVLSTAATIGLQLATIALNMAISAGLSLAITATVKAIDNWIHANENAIKSNNELAEQSKSNRDKYLEEAGAIDDSIESYKKLSKEYEDLKKKKEEAVDKKKSTSDIDADMVSKSGELYELQVKINEELKGTGKQVQLVREATNDYGEKVLEVNDSYKQQLDIVKSIRYEKQKQALEEAKRNVELAQTNYDLGVDDIFLTATDTEGQYKELLEMRELMEKEGRTASNDYKILQEEIKDIEERQEKLNVATGEYLNLLGELYLDTGRISKFSEALSGIANSYANSKGPLDLINQLQQLNSQFVDGEIDAKKYFDEIQNSVKNIDFSALRTINNQAEELQRSSMAVSENVVDVTKSAIDSLSDMSISLAGTNEETISSMNNTTNVATELTEEQIDELRAYEAIFAETTSLVAENLSNLMDSYEAGKTSWVEYSEALGESAESSMELYTKLNDLHFDEQANQWRDATDAVDEYATALQNSLDGLNELGPLLETIGDNYNYIAENSNVAGEAMFKVSDVGTQAYNTLAANVASALDNMMQKDSEAAKRIIDNAYKSSGYTTEAYDYSYKSVSADLQKNSQLLNNVLNQSAVEAAAAAGNVSAGVGNILSKLGNAISNFDYNIEATPYISGSFGIKKDANGMPTGIQLPKFGFDINGKGGSSIQGLAGALQSFGSGLASRGAYEFAYKPTTASVGKAPSRPSIDTSTGGGSGSSGKSGGSGGSGGSGSSSNYHAEKEASEEYKNKLKAFTDYVSNKEKLEEKWVKRQKELNQLSDKDYLYITQQRINRYRMYLDQVKKMTWLNDEDRIELENKYVDAIQDAEVEYLKYVEKQTENQIKELKEANKEKIQMIKDEATERINALKKIKNETSRIRDEEDYDKQRQEILEEISYWEQRTGREAAKSLEEAKDKLAELDQEWREQLEDWSIEDQIQAIEDERDAQVQAIEDSQEAEIKALQAVYDERVRLYVETGQIIYDQSQIESANLYNAYKSNFVDPIMSDLNDIQNKISGTSSSASTGTATSAYESYTIQKGDTLSKIAKRYSTTVSKLMEANPYITNANKIYAGKTLQIPKFHEGGIVGGTQEAYALLKPNEVILKTEWAASLDRMMKYFDNVTMGKDVGPVGGTNIEVTGNLVNIEADIKNETDMNNLTRKIERMLKDKFNINK